MVESKTTERIGSYVDRIRQSALPRWAEQGWDEGGGRFRERLGWNGETVDVPHRAMVQARQIYVYARAAHLGWFPDGRRLAEAAMSSLIRNFGESDGKDMSFAFSINPASAAAIVSPTRDAYTHAFVLFAIAALYELNGDRQLLDVADRTIRFLRRRMTDSVHDGLFDALPSTRALKRQNPHMHFLEAYLALERAAPEREYAANALDLVALFKRCFFRSPPGVLLEYFSEDWSACVEAGLAELWEPGHHFEWVWLLAETRRLVGEQVEPWATTLYAIARQHGLTSEGRIYDELSCDLKVTKPSHRLWPHTEAIKAAVAMNEAGDATALPFAATMAGHLLDTFLDRPFAGGWIDHVTPEGTPLVTYVPASSLYHLFFAAEEATKLLRIGSTA